jgi:hypothetical protein
MNKIFAAMLCGACVLAQGVACAEGVSEEKNKQSAAFKQTVAVVETPLARKSAGSEYRSCGAFVASKTRHGYGFGSSQAAATAKAHEMCAASSCQVVSVGCDD